MGVRFPPAALWRMPEGTTFGPFDSGAIPGTRKRWCTVHNGEAQASAFLPPCRHLNAMVSRRDECRRNYM